MLDYPFRSARQLARDIRRKKVGALELLELYLARVERHNPRLNAIVVTDLGGARTRPRRGLGGPARGADDDQGVVRRRRHADDVGAAAAEGQLSPAQRARRGPPARGGGGHSWAEHTAPPPLR